MVTAIIGAGGKTTLLHSLAEKYIKEGKSVFVTTTTHMLIEPDTLLTDNPEEIKAELLQKGYAMAGIQSCSETPDCKHTVSDYKKMTALSDSTYEEICRFADEILVEADGAKHFPLKIPNESEPVIPENADRIIVVCGMHSIGKSAREAIFRLDTTNDTFGITEDTIITPNTIQYLINKCYMEKLMEKYKDKEIIIHAANAESLYERAAAALIEAKMDANLIDETWFSKKPCLFICGAGHVSKELADIAAKIDMKVKVIDPRVEWANEERYPNAEIINDSFSSLDKYLVPNAYYAVITPGHKDDFACVSSIMGTSYSYLGMIGSHKKVATTISSLREHGFLEEQISTLHAPIGLSIGAETPAEIAISILAEIIEIKNKHSVSSVSEELLDTNKHGMLCIVIDKQGSTPRGVGSMMLVNENEIIDTIGGGAIENAAINAARANKSAFIEEYALNNTEASNLGMVCGGKNTVLFLPV